VKSKDRPLISLMTLIEQDQRFLCVYQRRCFYVLVVSSVAKGSFSEC
jgi:hypothetical protein